MTPNATVSYGIRNLSQYRVLFVGDYTIPNPRTAYFRNNGEVTIRANDPKDSMTFTGLGTVWAVKRDSRFPLTETVKID